MPEAKVAPSVSVERAAGRMSIPASLPTNDAAPAVMQGSLDTRQGSAPDVNTCRVELKSISAKPNHKSDPGQMFDTFAHDPYGVRNFHVVEGSIQWSYEKLIKVSGVSRPAMALSLTYAGRRGDYCRYRECDFYHFRHQSRCTGLRPGARTPEDADCVVGRLGQAFGATESHTECRPLQSPCPGRRAIPT